MWPGRSSWKKVERKKDHAIFDVRMLVDVKHANWRKAQKSTGCTTAQNGTRSDGKSQRLSEKWEQKAETSKKEWQWQKRYSRTPTQWTPVEQRKFQNNDVGARKASKLERLESGELVAGPWCSLIMMQRWDHCVGCPAHHQEGGADGLLMPSQESDRTHQGACGQQGNN